MASDAPDHLPAAPDTAPTGALPAPSAYLRGVIDLGRSSIPRAIPALLFLWAYHFGTGLFLELSGGGTSPLGYHDTAAMTTQLMMKMVAALPLFVLVYTPFLPLQDGLLRGEPVTFWAAARHVLERIVPLVLSVVLQILIVGAPVMLVGGIVVAAFGVAGLPREILAVILVVALIPLILWLLVMGTLLVFATPNVVLSDRGPWRAITASVRLSGGHFWVIVLRFILFFIMLMIAVMIVTLPVMFASTLMGWVTRAQPFFRISTLLWTSLLTAFTFPFGVASVLLLYRALVPAGAMADTAAMGTAASAGHDALRAPGEPHTPFQFE